MAAHRENSQWDKVILMKNRQPRWSDSRDNSRDRVELGAFVLDFQGRVKVPSIKNFVLTDEQDREISMIFGKVDENLFTMSATWPLSLMQAFGLSVSSIANKYGCE